MQLSHSPLSYVRLLLTLSTASTGLWFATPSWAQSTPLLAPTADGEAIAAPSDAQSTHATLPLEDESASLPAVINSDHTTADTTTERVAEAPALGVEAVIAPSTPEQSVDDSSVMEVPDLNLASTTAADLTPDSTDSTPVYGTESSLDLAQVPPGARPPDPRRGFSAQLGSALRPPTSLLGPTRPRSVIPGNARSTGFFSMNGHARWDISDNQYVLLEAIAGETILGADLSYTYLLDTDPRQGLSVNVFNQRSFYPAFTGGDPDVDLPTGETPWVHRLGAGVEYFQPIAPQLDASIGVNYQRVSVRDDFFSNDLFPFDEDGNALTFGDTGQDELLTINLAAVYSSLDSPRYPTEGTRIRVGMDQAIPIGEAEIGFNRLAGSVTQFIPLDLFGFAEGPRTLVLNLQAGTIIGDVPPYESFNLGGVNSVRGFSKGGVGSGSSFLQATAEYRFPLAELDFGAATIPLVGLLFVDYGTDLGTADEVTGEPAEVRDRPGDGLGIGFGVRALTPFGTARLEFGFNDNGGSELHFTLGERF